jgi:hypothetical protein
MVKNATFLSEREEKKVMKDTLNTMRWGVILGVLSLIFASGCTRKPKNVETNRKNPAPATGPGTTTGGGYSGGSVGGPGSSVGGGSVGGSTGGNSVGGSTGGNSVGGDGGSVGGDGGSVGGGTDPNQPERKKQAGVKVQIKPENGTAETVEWEGKTNLVPGFTVTVTEVENKDSLQD